MKKSQGNYPTPFMSQGFLIIIKDLSLKQLILIVPKIHQPNFQGRV